MLNVLVTDITETTEQIGSYLSDLIQFFHTKKDQKTFIIITSTIPSPKTEQISIPSTTAIHYKLRGLQKTFNQNNAGSFKYVNFNQTFIQEVEPRVFSIRREYFHSDLVHLNRSGAEVLAHYLILALKDLADRVFRTPGNKKLRRLENKKKKENVDSPN